MSYILMLRVTGTCSLFCQTLLVCFVLMQHNELILLTLFEMLGEQKENICLLDEAKITLGNLERLLTSYILLVSTDVLTNNLIREALSRDKKENLNEPPSQRTTKHLDSLKAATSNHGVSFNVREKKNADGKGSSCYDFTSLMGSDKTRGTTKILHCRKQILTQRTFLLLIILFTSYSFPFFLLFALGALLYRTTRETEFNCLQSTLPHVRRLRSAIFPCVFLHFLVINCRHPRRFKCPKFLAMY